ncbi:MAG: S4 domain-containing protein [Pseudomonadales bacterium]
MGTGKQADSRRGNSPAEQCHAEKRDPVRIDKWLWAARFFKTRSLAKQAVEGGKVQYNGQRVKSSKTVEVGAEIRVRCGYDDKVVRVVAVAGQRRAAAEAARLYAELDSSIAAREARIAQRRALREAEPRFDQRPNKKQRRQIHRFKHIGTSAHKDNE